MRKSGCKSSDAECSAAPRSHGNVRPFFVCIVFPDAAPAPGNGPYQDGDSSGSGYRRLPDRLTEQILLHNTIGPRRFHGGGLLYYWITGPADGRGGSAPRSAPPARRRR